MYYCESCKSEFEEPTRKKITFEDYYGVDNLFTDSHRMDILVCPVCGDDNIEEMQQCDYCEEWFLQDDLEDTSEAINGGCGYLCEQCIQDCDIIL